MAWEWISESDCPSSASEPQRKDIGDGKQQQQQAEQQQQPEKSTPTQEQLFPFTSQAKELEQSVPSLSSSNNANSSVSFEHLKEMMLTQTQQISDLKSIVENQRVMIDQLLSHRLNAYSEIPMVAAVSDRVVETNHDIEQVEPTAPDCEPASATVAKVVDRNHQDNSITLRSAPSSNSETSPATFQVQRQEQQPAASEYHDVTPAINNNPTTTSTSQLSQSDDHIDPPTFFGQRSRARAWLSDYDSIMDINGYDNFQRLIIAEAYMVGEAREWYCRTLDARPRIDWPGFKELFLRKFCAVDQITRDRNQPPSRSNNCESPINGAFRALDGFVKQIFDTNRRQ